MVSQKQDRVDLWATPFSRWAYPHRSHFLLSPDAFPDRCQPALSPCPSWAHLSICPSPTGGPYETCCLLCTRYTWACRATAPWGGSGLRAEAFAHPSPVLLPSKQWGPPGTISPFLSHVGYRVAVGDVHGSQGEFQAQVQGKVAGHVCESVSPPLGM